ncbi:MAG: U32 family peptidase [Candidatus Aureabacteria bacterium]|nr:U32 family peptidase [Candidatus Auribacterota bacterium]
MKNSQTTQKFSIPCNWDMKLFEINTFLDSFEFYGKDPNDFFGGGRADITLLKASKKQVSSFLKKCQSKKINFNYLFNHYCASGLQFSKKGVRFILDKCDYLLDSGVSSLTVSDPYLAKLIKKNYPDLKINASVFCRIETLEKAKYWQELGASRITLFSNNILRNKERLGSIVKNISIPLQLIVNNCCLYHCVNTDQHANLESHSSGKVRESTYLNYYTFDCRYSRLLAPHLIIKSNFIRPEDLKTYQDLGIHHFKITDRTLSPDKIIKITKAYADNAYPGNLSELMPIFTGSDSKNRKFSLNKILYFFKPFKYNVYKLYQFLKSAPYPVPYINNEKLNGYLEKIFKVNCETTDCDQCLICKKIADEAILIDRHDLELIKDHKLKLENLFVRGDLFK